MPIDILNLRCDPSAVDVCLELSQPPRFERQMRSGDQSKSTRARLPHLGGDHASIAPYAYQVRLILSDLRAHRDLTRLCEEAGICPPPNVPIDVVAR